MHPDLEYIIFNFLGYIRKINNPKGFESYQIKISDEKNNIIYVYINICKSEFKIEKYETADQIWIDLPTNIEPEFHDWLKLIKV